MPNSLVLRVVGDCDEGIVDSFEFFGGDARTLKLQVFNDQNEQKVCIPSTSTKTLLLSGTPNDIQVNNADITLNPDDSSIFSVWVTPAMSAAMISGIIQFTYTYTSGLSTVTRYAKSEYGLKRLLKMGE